MDLRQLFTHQTWWGKLIGAFFGFLISGPTGALLGILIGNFFDRGLSMHFSQPFWHYQSEKNKAVQLVFFESLFALLGHIAKADGLVSEEAIHYAKDIMIKMKLTAREQQSAQYWFQQGKSRQFNLNLTLNTLYKAIQHKPNLIRLLVETQYQSIKTTGISERKITIMNHILSGLQLAPLYQHYQFMHDYPWYTPHQQAPNHHHRQHSYHQQAPSQPPFDNAYSILNITPSATQAEVKRAYRRQMSHYHPDKLIAKGASASSIKTATEKTQQIRKAYEHICNQRGW